MTFAVLALALALQRPPAPPAPTKPAAAANASIAGTVVRAGGDYPLPNILVTLARIDASEATSLLRDALGQSPSPVESFESMKALVSSQGARSLPPVYAAMRALPLDSIRVDSSGRVAMVSKNTPPIQTDGGGHFAFQNVEPGTYRLLFAANGFVSQDYGERLGGAAGVPIVLAAGQSLEGLTMRMIPTGAISGRTMNVAGQPIGGVPVQLVRSVYDASGKNYTRTLASAQTDDRGEYRFFFLTPGRYYITAGGGHLAGLLESVLESVEDWEAKVRASSGRFGRAFGRNGLNRVPEDHFLMFYPSAADLASATSIEVASGADVEGIDISVAPQRYYTALGRVVDDATGRPPESRRVRVSAVRLADPMEPGSDDVGVAAAGGRYDPTDGTFELRNLSPGTYAVIANLGGVNPGADGSEQRMAVASVAIGNADVTGVVLAFAKGSPVSGYFRLEGNAPGRQIQFNQLQVLLTGDRNLGADAPTAKADGQFRIDFLYPDEYRFSVRGLPDGFFVKSVKYGDADVTARSIALPNEKSGAIEITIGFGVGAVNGVVTDADGRPAPSSRVVLVPAGNHARTELFKSATAGVDGRYRIAGVVPGDYRLISWDILEAFGYFDPALLAQAEAKGKLIHVDAASTLSVDTQTVPLPRENKTP